MALSRSLPRPGSPVRGSSTGRPIMALLDLLGRRGALRLLWELREGRALTFRALQDAAATNPSLLNTRLKELRAAGVVQHDEGAGYALSPSGTRLLAALAPLAKWAAEWQPPAQPVQPAKAEKATQAAARPRLKAAAASGKSSAASARKPRSGARS